MNIDDFNLANVNERISKATILTDNKVMIDRYQGELSDLDYNDLPGKSRKEIKKDKVNGPIPLKSNVDLQNKIMKEIL